MPITDSKRQRVLVASCVIYSEVSFPGLASCFDISLHVLTFIVIMTWVWDLNTKF